MSPVRLAHLWVDFRVIFVKTVLEIPSTAYMTFKVGEGANTEFD